MSTASRHIQGCWVKFGIDLHPSRSEDVLGGVKEQLNGLLLRYNEDLEGVLLSHTKERILGTQAKVHPYFPYFHVDVLALVFVFKPAAGAPIDGVVNAIGHDYIGVLVLGIFNAAIGRAQIPAHIQCRPLENCWTSSKDRHTPIEVGTELHFTVHTVNYEGEFFTLSGSLLESEKAELAAGSRAHARPLPVATKPRRPAGVQAAAAAQQPWRRQPAAAAAEGQSAARAAQADGAAPPRPVAEPPATDGAAQQPEHRKKSKRRDGGDAGAVNGVDSAVKPPKKKKAKTNKVAAS